MRTTFENTPYDPGVCPYCGALPTGKRSYTIKRQGNRKMTLEFACEHVVFEVDKHYPAGVRRGK